MESSPDGVPGVTGRFGFDTNISLHDMGDSYLAQYKIAIPEGKALGMMCSYTSINGTAVCESTRWQQDWARKKMGFEGNIVTDCGALSMPGPEAVADPGCSARSAGNSPKCGMDGKNPVKVAYQDACHNMWQGACDNYGRDSWDLNTV